MPLLKLEVMGSVLVLLGLSTQVAAISLEELNNTASHIDVNYSQHGLISHLEIDGDDQHHSEEYCTEQGVVIVNANAEYTFASEDQVSCVGRHFDNIDSSNASVTGYNTATSEAYQFNSNDFMGTVFDVYTEDGSSDNPLCVNKIIAVQMNFLPDNTFTAENLCDGGTAQGSYSFEQNYQVLVLSSPDFDQDNFVVAIGDRTSEKQGYCWVDDEDYATSSEALICKDSTYSDVTSEDTPWSFGSFYFDEVSASAATTFDGGVFTVEQVNNSPVDDEGANINCDLDNGEEYSCPETGVTNGNYTTLGDAALLDAGSMIVGSWHDVTDSDSLESGLTFMVKKAYGATVADIVGSYQLSVLGKGFSSGDLAEEIWMDTVEISFNGVGGCAAAAGVDLFDASQAEGDSLNNRAQLRAYPRHNSAIACSYTVAPSGQIQLIFDDGDTDLVTLDISADFQYLVGASGSGHIDGASLVLATKLNTSELSGDNSELSGSYFVAGYDTGFWVWSNGADKFGFDGDGIARAIFSFTPGETDGEGYSQCQAEEASFLVGRGIGFNSANGHYWGNSFVEGDRDMAASCRYKVAASGQVEIELGDGEDLDTLNLQLGASKNNFMLTDSFSDTDDYDVVEETFVFLGMGVKYTGSDVMAASRDFMNLPGVKADLVKSDFNGDAIADILWRNTDGTAEIAISSSNGSTDRIESLNSKSADWSAQLGDFNGDGAVDTLWRNSMSGAVKVAISDANGNQGAVHNLAAKGSVWLTQIGDFNGDGRDDILWRKPSEGFVRIGISNADGDQDRIEYFFNKGQAWQAFVGDFNGDDRDDILWRRGTDGSSKIVFTNTQGTQESVVNAVAFKRFSAWQVQVADLNGDGRDDIFWRKSSDGTVKVGISGADGKQASSVNHFAKFMAWTATLGDFNGDGGADILWRKPADGTVKIAITGAAGEQANVVGLPARFSAWTQQLADYNGDGRTDILWHKPASGDVKLGISSPMGYQQSEVSMGNKPSGWTVVH